MRRWLTVVISLLILHHASAQTGMARLSFRYSTVHIEKGYDHLSRMKVYVNGQLLAISPQKMESRPNKVSVSLIPGVYLVRAVLESQHGGRWEEHTKDNKYNIDCLFSGSVNLTKSMTISLLFDLNKGTIVKTDLK